jgi:hypothetical protein
LWRAIKRELPIQFGHEQLTSYGGLELVRRYFQLIGLNARIRRARWVNYLTLSDGLLTVHEVARQFESISLRQFYWVFPESLFYEPASVPGSGRVGIGWA